GTATSSPAASLASRAPASATRAIPWRPHFRKAAMVETRPKVTLRLSTMTGSGDVKNERERGKPDRRAGLSIGTKLTFATLAVVLAVSALLYRELSRRELASLLAAKETAATMVTDLFAESLSAPLDFADLESVSSELEHLERNPEVLCAAVFGKGPEPV